eukprot:Anaeramoba_flamelloidesa8467_17.p1 GENE.a8467_17~~a8467_17.p1  ORF type:complete len:244 (+),score=34.63 a8467_17:53-784(+)
MTKFVSSWLEQVLHRKVNISTPLSLTSHLCHAMSLLYPRSKVILTKSPTENALEFINFCKKLGVEIPATLTIIKFKTHSQEMFQNLEKLLTNIDLIDSKRYRNYKWTRVVTYPEIKNRIQRTKADLFQKITMMYAIEQCVFSVKLESTAQKYFPCHLKLCHNKMEIIMQNEKQTTLYYSLRSIFLKFSKKTNYSVVQLMIPVSRESLEIEQKHHVNQQSFLRKFNHKDQQNSNLLVTLSPILK